MAGCISTFKGDAQIVEMDPEEKGKCHILSTISVVLGLQELAALCISYIDVADACTLSNLPENWTGYAYFITSITYLFPDLSFDESFRLPEDNVLGYLSNKETGECLALLIREFSEFGASSINLKLPSRKPCLRPYGGGIKMWLSYVIDEEATFRRKDEHILISLKQFPGGLFRSNLWKLYGRADRLLDCIAKEKEMKEQRNRINRETCCLLC